MRTKTLPLLLLLAAAPAAADPLQDAALRASSLLEERGKSDAQALQDEVGRLQEIQIQMSEFLDRFSVEIVREPNLEQKGQLQGSLKGGGFNLQLGNVPALAKGLGGIAVEGGRMLNPLAYFGRPALDFDPISSVLSGLSGWGFGAMRLSGSIQGDFSGKGVQIHDAPHLFLVAAKNAKALAPALKALDAARAKTGPMTSAREVEPTAAALSALAASPYIPDVETLGAFRKTRDALKQGVRSADRLISRNLGSSEAVFRDAEKRVEIIKAWASSKRVIFAVAAPNPALLQVETSKVAAFCQDFSSLPPGSYSVYHGNTAAPACLEYPMESPVAWSERLRKEVTVYQRDGDLIKRDPVLAFTLKEFRVKARVSYAARTMRGEEIWSLLFSPENLEIIEERLLF